MHRAAAQLPPSPVPISNAEDARTLPKGTFLLRAMNAWTRIDEVYDAASDSAHHLHQLGNAFMVESLGVRQFPALLPVQQALRDLTGNPNLALNLGQTFSTVGTRFVTTPLSLSYGVTDRLTIGAMMPIVQTHSDVFVELNPRRLGTNTGANIGVGLPTQDLTALTAQLSNAAADLTNFINNCNGCSQLQQAKLLAQQDTAVAKAIALLYGTGSQFAPFGDATIKAVTDRLNALSSNISGITGGTYTFAAPLPANGAAALAQLRSLVTAAGYDSIGSPDRIGIGDVELSALFKLVDGFADTTGVRLRATLRGVLRIGSSLETPSGTVPFEVGIGTGQTSADGGAIVDVRLGRHFMSTFSGLYTAFFTSAQVPRLPNSNYALFPLDLPVSGTWRAGDAIQVEAMPRFLVTDFFTIHGAYTLRHEAASHYTSPGTEAPPLFAASTEQRAGIGFSYSAVARYAKGQSPLPLEVFFTHLETVAATGGLTPKYRRDQIEFRIYYRLRRGGR